MNSNALAFGAVGFYLLAVVINGKSAALWQALAQEQNFIKWAGALMALLIIKDNLKLGAVGNGLITVAFFAFVLNSVTKTTKKKVY